MTLNNELNDIKNRIQEFTQHPTLDKFVQKPVIDEDKIIVLFSMFQKNGTYKNVNQYITSIMIVQMALEIHDTISIETGESQDDIKPRQLTVLAGDYYSSQYYRLLSELGDLPMISRISEAIQQLNEQKTHLFKNDFQWNRLFDLLKAIETTMLVKISQYLGLSSWSHSIVDYFTFKRIYREKQDFLQGKISKFLYPMLVKKTERRKQFIPFVDTFLDDLKPKVEGSLHEEPFMGQLSLKPLSCLRESSFVPKRLAEEG